MRMASKQEIFAIALLIGLMSGCSTTQYIISTTDGTMIQASGKPKLDSTTGMYEYRDGDGKATFIQKDQVKQILER
jgi:uncharacterized protein YceK